MPVAIVAVPLALYALRESNRSHTTSRPSRCRTRRTRCVSGGVGDRSRQRRRLGIAWSGCVVGRFRSRVGAVRSSRDEDVTSGHATTSVPFTQLLDGERHRLDLLDRDPRSGVPSVAVPPDRDGLQPVPSRPADASVDGGADDLRSSRRFSGAEGRAPFTSADRSTSPGRSIVLVGRVDRSRRDVRFRWFRRY